MWLNSSVKRGAMSSCKYKNAPFDKPYVKYPRDLSAEITSSMPTLTIMDSPAKSIREGPVVIRIWPDITLFTEPISSFALSAERRVLGLPFWRSGRELEDAMVLSR